MSNYIDGFVHPIHRSKLNEYLKLVTTVAEIWKEHGALDYCEYLGDDMQLEGTTSFNDFVNAKDDEAVLFGWVTFDSRETRDLANKRVATDPRMETLMAESDIGFNAQRMVYGGFQSFLR
jgi:uncharacterized protein YbaA (DUF1428 family)